MEEEQKNMGQESAQAPQPPVMAETVEFDAKDVADGKAFAILSYVLSLLGLPFFLVPLIMRNNAFALYHSKQSLMVCLMVIAGGLLNIIPCLGQIAFVAILVFALVVIVMGLINASNGVAKPLPLIGKWGEEWFKGITKV